MSDSRFEKITSIDNLRKAWIKVHQFAKTDEIFYDEYAYNVFSEHLEARLYDLARELRNGSYRPSLLRYINIPKGTKSRKIYFSSPKDSVVIQAVINIVGPGFEADFIKESFGNRLNVDAQESKDAYQNWPEKYSEYVAVVRGFAQFGLSSWYLITDIENYYPSISKEWLSGLFKASLDAETCRLIDFFIYLDALDDSEEREGVLGIPPGPIYGHFFANVYLDEFDHLAKKMTLGYARYVDDICFVCDSQESVDKTKGELSKFLARWNQKFKEKEKTTQHSILDIEPLYDHTRKMKYATRLDIVETYEESAEDADIVGSTEKPFFRLYKIAERAGDLKSLVEEAGYLVSLLRQSGDDQDLADVVYSLLETHPVRPSTLKTALASLLEIEKDHPSEKFRQFFLGDHPKSPYVSALFLRILSLYEWENSIAKEIVTLYLKDSHYLVRANAYVTLKRLDVFLDGREFASLLAHESSTYAKERLIDCYPKVIDNTDELGFAKYLGDSNLSIATLRTYIELIKQNKVKRDFINVIWAAVKEKKLSFDFYVYLYYLAASQDFLWLANELLKLPEKERLLNLIPPVALEVINKLAADAEIIRLHQFISHLSKLGFMQEAMVGHFQATSNSSEVSLPEELSAVVKDYEKEAGLPGWVSDVTSTRHLYYEESNDTEYLCQYVEDKNKNKGILEIISLDRIKSGGFESANDWGKHLQMLVESNVLPKIYLAKYGETKFACFYEFPPEYLPLAKILSNETTKASLSQSNIFRLGEALLENIERSSTKTFTLHSINPSSILWSPITGKHFLIGVGASLGTGKYYCSLAGCRTPSTENEIGISATVFHFGLLMYQLLADHCPVQDILNTLSKYDSVKISDLLSKLNILPHYRMILGRLLNSDPEKRYRNTKDLTFDFKQANRFRAELESFSDSEYERKTLSTLMDFITFRLRVISRNPSMKSNSPIAHANRIIGELANTIQYLPSEMTKLWAVGLENRSSFAEFPPTSQIRKLSPEGRRLLDIAFGWEKVHRGITSNPKQLTVLARLLLYRVLVVEALASLAGILSGLSDGQKDAIQIQTVKFSEAINALIKSDKNEQEVSLQIADQTYPLTFTKRDLLDLQRVQQWLTSKGNLSEFVPSLRILGIFLILNGTKVDVSVESASRLTTKIIFGNHVDDISKLTWILIRSFPSMDEQIREFHILCSNDFKENSHLMDNDVWLMFPDYQKYVGGLNPAKRRFAEVYNYQIKNFHNEAEGLVQLVSLRKQSIRFASRDTYISGNPGLIDPYMHRPVLVDLVKTRDRQLVPSAVLAPLGKFVELPFKQRVISPFKIAFFLNRYKEFYSLAWPLLLLVFGAIAWVLSQVIISIVSGSSQPIIQVIFTVFSMICVAISTNYAKKLMGVINPEDNDSLIKKNKISAH